MKVLLQDSHNPNGGGAPGEAAWVMQLNDEIEVRARQIGISVTRVPGNLKDYPSFHADYNAFLAPHYDANIYGEGGWFWDRAKASTTADLDDKLGAIFARRYTALVGDAIPFRPNRRNANTWDYYGFRLTSAKTPGIIVEHGVGALNAPDYDWLRNNLDAIAQCHVDTWAEYANVSDQKRYYVLGSASPIAVPNVDPAIVDLYRTLAPALDIRTEIAVAQAIHETNWFKFTGEASPDYHNPSGMRIQDYYKFDSWEQGIRAHLGHLYRYFAESADHVQGFCDVDPKHGSHFALPNDIRQLNGRWAIPGDNYGQAIANVVDSIVTGTADDFWHKVDSAPVTWGDLKQYASRLQAQLDNTYARKVTQ